MSLRVGFNPYITFFRSSIIADGVDPRGAGGGRIQSIKTYLQEAKSHALNLKPGDVVNVVMGTQACDLDSIVASIGYAYLKTQKNTSELSLPLLNIPKADYRLRTEAAYLLGQADIGEEHLNFTDTINLQEWIKQGIQVRLTLVDHNNLAPAQQYLWPAVQEIIDHHKDEKAYEPKVAWEIVDGLGSTSTLVAERIWKFPELHTQELALLLLGTILLDTINLDQSKGRVKPRDLEIAAQLSPWVIDVPKYPSFKSQDDLYNTVVQAREDVSNLSFFDLLRKDYKSGKDTLYGIASVVGLSLEDYIKKSEDLIKDLEQFREANGLQALFLITTHQDNGIWKRELMIYAPDEQQLEKLSSFLQNNQQLYTVLQESKSTLQAIPVFENPSIRTFSLAREISRKVLDPVLKTFIE